MAPTHNESPSDRFSTAQRLFGGSPHLAKSPAPEADSLRFSRGLHIPSVGALALLRVMCASCGG